MDRSPEHEDERADNENAEIFSPPYLFKGARPAVASAPATGGFGATIAIATTSAVSRVTLVRLSTSTHALNMGQRFQDLAFTTVAGGVNATLPPNANVCTPGHYMLFLLNANGVPSIGRVIQVGVGAGGRVAGAAALEPSRADRLAGREGSSFRLGAPNPNPTAGGCEFSLTLPRDARVQARVYDVAGRLVREVARGHSLNAGTHRLRWDGMKANGTRASRGIYWIEVRFGSERMTRRVTLLN